MKTKREKTFTVSAEWMAACGKGKEARSFPVARVHEYPWVGQGFRKMFEVETSPGQFWIVAECRGKLNEEEKS